MDELGLFSQAAKSRLMSQYIISDAVQNLQRETKMFIN